MAISNISFTLKITYKANGNKMEDMNADTGDGAFPCASGSQVFIGNNAALVQNPITINKNENCNNEIFTVLISIPVLMISLMVSDGNPL